MRTRTKSLLAIAVAAWLAFLIVPFWLYGVSVELLPVQRRLDELETGMLQLRRHEKDFLQRRTTHDLVDFRVEQEHMLDAVDDLRRSTTIDPHDLEQITGLLGDYRSVRRAFGRGGRSRRG